MSALETRSITDFIEARPGARDWELEAEGIAVRSSGAFRNEIGSGATTLDDNGTAAAAGCVNIVATEAHACAGAFWSRVLTPVVTASTEAVIWVGMRV